MLQTAHKVSDKLRLTIGGKYDDTFTARILAFRRHGMPNSFECVIYANKLDILGEWNSY